MNGRTVLYAVIAIIIGISLVALLQLGKEDTPIPPVQETVSATGRTVGENILVTRQFFSPNTLTIKQGDSLMLIFKSLGVERAITIPSLGVTQTLPADQGSTVTTKPLAKGEITIYCTKGCDPNVSMKVTIE